MYELLEIYKESKDYRACALAVREKLKGGCSKIPLHTALEELGNRTLYSFLHTYGKFKQWTISDFITMGAVNYAEKDSQDFSLMQCLIRDENLEAIKQLLPFVFFDLADYQLASPSLRAFFDYRPGHGKPVLKEYAALRTRDVYKLRAMILDQADTSDGSSSSAEFSENEQLTPQELKEYLAEQEKQIKAFNGGAAVTKIKLIAARGVHYLARYFPTRKSRERIAETRHQPHTTYSLSTLFDAGFKEDEEPNENDKKIVARHEKNIAFIKTLEKKPDAQEKKIGAKIPAASRNSKVFDSHFWRYIQVYINSYSYMFNDKAIMYNFGFDTGNNPEISMSWNIEKAMMYASGCRFDWAGKAKKRDPHYRRFSGRPKHPNMGYVDIFEFSPEYVRENSVDRLLAYNEGKIALSNLFCHEAEVIFHSMVSAHYHIKRRVICLPSFDEDFNNQRDTHLGIVSKSVHTLYKNKLQKLGEGRNTKGDYQKIVAKLTNNAVKHQAELLEKTMQARLFRAGKVQAYDHGASLQAQLPAPKPS